jgi:hypothetical protein
MSMEPTTEKDDQDREADRQASALKDQLRKDVASWSAARNDTSSRYSAELSVPPPKPAAAQPVAKKRQPKAAPAEAPRVATAKKPFSMSYDGVTTAEHITYLLSRGTK